MCIRDRLKRVGPRIGLRTVRDLLLWLPRRYDDLRVLHELHALRFVAPDTIVSTRASVVRVRAGRTARRGIRVVTADLADETGTAEAQWYGRQFVERRLHEGDELLFSGKLKKRGATVLLANPAFQAPDGDLLHVGRIVPVYRLTAGLPIRTLRAAIRAALDRPPPYAEYLPASIRRGLGLVGIEDALAQVHFPDDFERRDAALRRLAFDELLALQVGMVGRRRAARSRPGSAPGPAHPRSRPVPGRGGSKRAGIPRTAAGDRGPRGSRRAAFGSATRPSTGRRARCGRRGGGRRRVAGTPGCPGAPSRRAS